MSALLLSTGLVALAEIGDKTQLLSLTLAARYRKPWPIMLGVLVATLLNHGVAAALGDALAHVLTPRILDWVVVFSFLIMGLWIMVPDKAGEEDKSPRGLSIFATTVVVYFLAEMGDKTQVATVALAARYQEWLPVVTGTTLGMMLANVPAVLFGHRFADRLPTRLVHGIAALLFIAMGAFSLHQALQAKA